MKNFLKHLNDPRKLLGIGGLLFVIGAIDTWILGASSFAEMYWWSKIAFVLLVSMILLGAVMFFFIPLFKRKK